MSYLKKIEAKVASKWTVLVDIVWTMKNVPVEVEAFTEQAAKAKAGIAAHKGEGETEWDWEKAQIDVKAISAKKVG